MRILMLNNEFPPRGGGSGTVNRELFLQFAKIPNVEIDLITSGRREEDREEIFSKNIKICKVPVDCRNIHHASNSELLIYAYRAFFKSLSRHRKRSYDFCFAWSTVPSGTVALLLRLFIGLRYLVRVSGPDIPGFESRYKWIYPFLVPIVRSVWAGAEMVVAKCTKEQEMIRSIHKNANTKIIHNGVDISIFAPSERSADDRPFRVLCVGRLIERKGQRFLIEAVKHLSDEGAEVTLDLVGTGDSLHAYRSMAEKLGIEQMVRFLGYIPREEIVNYYANADVFVLPSYNEGMSIALLEAMASGLPVVTTKTGGSDELVEEGINGFTFEWGDMDALITHLRKMYFDRTLSHRMGISSRNKATGFSWGMATKAYMDLMTAFISPADNRYTSKV